MGRVANFGEDALADSRMAAAALVPASSEDDAGAGESACLSSGVFGEPMSSSAAVVSVHSSLEAEGSSASSALRSAMESAMAWLAADTEGEAVEEEAAEEEAEEEAEVRARLVVERRLPPAAWWRRCALLPCWPWLEPPPVDAPPATAALPPAPPPIAAPPTAGPAAAPAFWNWSSSHLSCNSQRSAT